MAEVTYGEVQQAMFAVADGVLMQPVSAEQHRAAVEFKTSTECAYRSFKALRLIGTRYAVRFEELGDYETANMINAAVLAAY
jgi:hypothetical protein